MDIQIRDYLNLKKLDVIIRWLEEKDIPAIARAFEELGWNKPASQYKRYLSEQVFRVRDVYLAFLKGQFAGYLTICWKSNYEPFRQANIPEITDFNVLPKFRRIGIGTQLMDKAEDEIAGVSSIAGIGVGMTPDYGAAQRLYILRGYVPDGCGLHWKDHPVQYGEELRVDDDLVLYFTKKLN
jgi:GNAT superfamily N-acetyltransferase